MTIQVSRPVEQLLYRGVVIPCPGAVEVGDDVDPGRIATGVIIHTGSRILGAKTSIGPGCEIGAESPATVENCQLGHKVSLKGGYFSGATFLDGSSMGSAAHVRSGTLLEEEASGGHAVAFKQTILLPFVTAGSLINFCDGLMAGGTSRKNHSEIGSSYIHFNYTPHQDKATPSLIGDVPRGVMLDQPPIFLGGQGGLVGPVRIGYGTVIPAGVIWRGDAPEGGQILNPPPQEGGIKPYQAGAYHGINRIVLNNLFYLGNLRALQAWYRFVRRPFMTGDEFTALCCEGALNQLNSAIDERIKRLKELAEKMPRSLELARAGGAEPAYCAEQERLVQHWPKLEAALKKEPGDGIAAGDRAVVVSALEPLAGKKPFLEAVRSLPAGARKAGTAWLQAVVDEISNLWKTPP